MARDVGLTIGDFTILLVSSVYTILVAILHCGIGFGAIRGLRWLWSVTLPRVSWIGSWQAAALLLIPVIWVAFRPTKFNPRASRGGG